MRRFARFAIAYTGMRDAVPLYAVYALLFQAEGLSDTAISALWLLAPTVAGFVAGFVLWGIGGALASGTWESLVYDALVDLDATPRYAGIIGGGESAGWLAAVASAALTTPLLAAGGYPLVGWTSVGVMALHACAAMWLPAPPRTGVDPDAEGEAPEEEGRSASRSTTT